MSYLTNGLPALLELLQRSDVRELELQEGEVHVRLHRMQWTGQEDRVDDLAGRDMPPALGPSTHEITAPLVGTFYRAGQPGMPPLVEEGSRVEQNTVVGIIEALQVLTDVEAGRSGVVTRVLATDGQPVEYGQPLFEVMDSEP